MKNIWAELQGSKTYLVAIATVVYGLGISKAWWPHSVLADSILGGGGIAALRSGVKTEVQKVAAAPKP
jgi:hypothetical protein